MPLFKMARFVRRWRTWEGVLVGGGTSEERERRGERTKEKDKIRRISGNPVILLCSSQRLI